MTSNLRIALVTIGLLCGVGIAHAAEARTVHLRKDCTGVPAGAVCKTTVADVLADLQTAGNEPSQTNPTLVDIGPGEFVGPFECIGWTHLSLRGAGQGITVLKSGTPAGSGAFIGGTSGDISLRDITFQGSQAGITWLVPVGRMDLWDVSIVVGGGGGPNFGWWDHCLLGSGPQEVYWFNTRIEVNATSWIANYALYSDCAEHWVYGSDFHTRAMLPTTGNQMLVNSVYQTGGDVRLFGSSARVSIDPSAAGVDFADLAASGFTIPAFAGVFVHDGIFHMHGGVISADASGASKSFDAIGIRADNAVLAHTPGTAFELQAPTSGGAIRLQNVNSTILSPYLWPSGDTTPSVETLSGADLFVETDCDSAGDCSGSGSRPHLMIHSEASCGAVDPWLDVVTGVCRNVNN